MDEDEARAALLAWWAEQGGGAAPESDPES
jgi:hypothetical protein